MNRNNLINDDGEESGEDSTIKEFRNLTEYDKKKHDAVKEFVLAMKRLEELGVLKAVGKVSEYLYEIVLKLLYLHSLSKMSKLAT
jgi:hypothetical protein